VSLEWNPDFIAELEAGKYDWVAYLVCPRCRATWRGILPGERPGAFGPIEEECPDCELGFDGDTDG
jgi:hypothetical protein